MGEVGVHNLFSRQSISRTLGILYWNRVLCLIYDTVYHLDICRVWMECVDKHVQISHDKDVTIHLSRRVSSELGFGQSLRFF